MMKMIKSFSENKKVSLGEVSRDSAVNEPMSSIPTDKERGISKKFYTRISQMMINEYDITKIAKINGVNILQIFKDSEEMRRKFLNMFSHNIDIALAHIKRLVSFSKIIKHKLQTTTTDNTATSHEPNLNHILYTLGKDKSGHPIIAFNFSIKFSIDIFISHLPEVITFIQSVIDKELNNKIEDIIFFVDLHTITESFLCENFTEIISIFQYIFPSRMNCMYIKIPNVATFAHINRAFVEYNMNRIKIVDNKMLKDMRSEYDPKVIENFFMPEKKQKMKTLAECKIEWGFGADKDIKEFNSGHFNERCTAYKDNENVEERGKVIPVVENNCIRSRGQVWVDGSLSIDSRHDFSIQSRWSHSKGKSFEISKKQIDMSILSKDQTKGITKLEVSNCGYLCLLSTENSHTISCKENTEIIHPIEKTSAKIRGSKQKTQIVVDKTRMSQQCAKNCNIY